jgi:hypothetical protein
MVRPLTCVLFASLIVVGLGAASSADVHAAVAHGDDHLWLGAGTSANPLVHGVPKYCTENQHVAAWESEACHYARLAWAEQHPVSKTRPAAQPHPPKKVARTADAAPPRAVPEPTDAPDDAAPGEMYMPTEAPATAPPTPMPTVAPPTPRPGPTRPSYASGSANPAFRHMAGSAPNRQYATPAPTAAPEETDPPETTPRAVARSAGRETAIPSDVQAVRYTPSTRFAWTASKAFSACFTGGGGAQPLGALTEALTVKDTQGAVEDANRVYAVARPCDRSEAASGVGVSELALLQSWLYAERSFWSYADLKLQLAQTELDAASHRDGFTELDPARIARLRATIASLKSVIAAHPE